LRAQFSPMNQPTLRNGLLLLAFLISSCLVAQDLILDMRAGISAFRSETSKNADFLIEELGQDFSLHLSFPLDNAQWSITGELGYSHTMAERDLIRGNNVIVGIYKTTAIHYFLGAGVRYVFSKDAQNYNLYSGQFLPYLGVSVGGVNFQNSTNRELVPANGFEISEKMHWGLATQAEAGFTVMLNDQWGLGGYMSWRLGFSDLWDGIDGLTQYDDWLVRGGISVTYGFD